MYNNNTQRRGVSYNPYSTRAQNKSYGAGAIILSVFFILLLYFSLISVAIAELDIGVKNLPKDHLCSSPDLVQFGLATWLTYGGLVNIIYTTILFPVALILRFFTNKNIYRIILVPSTLIYCLFLICWLITGFIIFDHADSDCKNKSKSVWSMTIASFFFRILNLIGMARDTIPMISKISCPKKNKKEDRHDSTSDVEDKSEQKSNSNDSNSNTSSSSSSTITDASGSIDKDTSSKNLATISTSSSS